MDSKFNDSIDNEFDAIKQIGDISIPPLKLVGQTSAHQLIDSFNIFFTVDLTNGQLTPNNNTPLLTQALSGEATFNV